LRHNPAVEHFPSAISIMDGYAHDERMHLGLLSGDVLVLAATWPPRGDRRASGRPLPERKCRRDCVGTVRRDWALRHYPKWLDDASR
jgi:hypothetical protein